MCTCGHPLIGHQTGMGPYTGWCGVHECECESPVAASPQGLSALMEALQWRCPRHKPDDPVPGCVTCDTNVYRIYHAARAAYGA